MSTTNRIFIAVSILLSALLLSSCTSYKSQEIAFRHPSAYGNVQYVAGAQIGAESFADRKRAEEAFGFDIRKAGLLPVQVVIDNLGQERIEIVSDQTFLVDGDGGMWNLLDRRTAYERLENSSEYARVAKGAGRGSVYGAAGGALLGAAIGILSGENVGNAALKGAALGGAGGAVVGGGSELGSDEGARQISRDLANKELQNRSIEPGMLGRGFLFFPGEAASASMLRIQFREVGNGQIHTLNMPLI